MRILIALTLILTSSLAYAEITIDEEIAIRELLAKKAKLLDLAETKTQALLPLEIKRLEAERDALIAERDGKLRDEDVKCKALQKTIEGTYETLIDAKESAINSKRGLIIGQ